MAAHPGRSRLGAVTWNGLDSFMDELRVLSAGMTEEANEVMRSVADSARASIAAAYPFKKGGLRRGVITRTPKKPGLLLAGVELVQTAPHGWIYEKGTKVRANKAGQNRGAMPARPVFDPIAARYRRAGIEAVIRRLEAKGAKVTRDASVTEE